MRNVTTKQDCLDRGYEWKNWKYNFDDLGNALMSLFVLSSKDGWVTIMYQGLDAVDVDVQVCITINNWMCMIYSELWLYVLFLSYYMCIIVEFYYWHVILLWIIEMTYTAISEDTVSKFNCLIRLLSLWMISLSAANHLCLSHSLWWLEIKCERTMKKELEFTLIEHM